VADSDDVQVLGAGNWVRLVSERGWEYAERIKSHGVVVILAVTDADEIVLVEQYRPAVKGRVIEAPAGLIGDTDATERAEAAARRELLEETGFRARGMEHLMECPSSPGMLAETFHFFRARGLERVGPGGGDASEDIEVHVVPLDDVFGFLRDRHAAGAKIDTKLFAALYLIGAYDA
jgi:ADP-ribose pyrophosphatase